MNSTLKSLMLVLAVALAFTGCGKKADTSKSVDQIRNEAQAMSVADLEANAKAYVSEIQAKKSEIEKVTDQVKQLSPADLLGEKSKSLKDQLNQLGGQISALTERYTVYAQQYQEKGGDLSQIQI